MKVGRPAEERLTFPEAEAEMRSEGPTCYKHHEEPGYFSFVVQPRLVVVYSVVE